MVFEKNEIVGVPGKSDAEMQVAEYFRVFSYEARGRALTKKQSDVSLLKTVFLDSLLLVPEGKAGGNYAGNRVFRQFKKKRRNLP